VARVGTLGIRWICDVVIVHSIRTGRKTREWRVEEEACSTLLTVRGTRSGTLLTSRVTIDTFVVAFQVLSIDTASTLVVILASGAASWALSATVVATEIVLTTWTQDGTGVVVLELIRELTLRALSVTWTSTLRTPIVTHRASGSRLVVAVSTRVTVTDIGSEACGTEGVTTSTFGVSWIGSSITVFACRAVSTIDTLVGGRIKVSAA
jgi:hypothetical protein